jgi:hydrophobe/amphiphile efflux-1 (HAE1) family protein
MTISFISIKRPVLTSMMSLALILFGLIALQRLPVRELPNIDPPIISVTTVYPGANAQVVETELTERLEEQLNSIEGIKTLTSESREQVSNITIEFNLRRNIDVAAQDVRDRVQRVRGLLPETIKEPIIAKQEADAQPVIWIALRSDRQSIEELSRLAELTLKDRLQVVEGVSSVYIGGQKRFAMRLWLDSKRMAAHQITVLDVDNALRQQNIELPSGRIEGIDRELAIQTLGEMKTAGEFNDLVIRHEGATLVRLKDIGEAREGIEVESMRGVARNNGQSAVALGIVKQTKANTIAVAQGVKEELERSRAILPPGVVIAMAYDESIFVEKSIEEVWVTLGIAFVLVVLVIFVFLRNLRSTIIPTVAIPVSIIATFALLAVFGYSVNILTMLALVLAIGIVVDDAIVVLENIHRHIEQGMKPMDAAMQGMKEIGFAIISITASLVAVFLPLAFQSSTAGRLFLEFAVAVAGSVIISAFVSLTLTPMMAARILKPIGQEKHGRIYNLFESGFARFSRHYSKLLRWALGHRITVSALIFAALGLTVVFYRALPNEFLPEEDKGFLVMFMIGPQGSTMEYADRQMRKAEKIVSEQPEVENYFSVIGLAENGPGDPSQGIMFMALKDQRARSVQDMVAGPTGLGARFFGEIQGAFSIPIIPKAFGFFGQSYRLVLQGTDLEQLYATTTQVVDKLRAAGFVQNVRSEFEMNKPELRISIDRNRAGTLGVSIQDISRTLQILFGGLDLSKIKLGGKEYDVVVQLDRNSRLTPGDLENLYVRNNLGKLVQLNNVVSYIGSGAPNAIYHYNRLRSAAIEGTPAGMPLGTAIDRTEEILKTTLPPGFRHTWAGEGKSLAETGQDIVFVLVLAVVIVFMVLASQFESLVHPFTVMLALPLAVFGALGLLWVLSGVNTLGSGLYAWTHYAPDAPGWAQTLSKVVPRIPAMNINLFSQIGLVLLVGLVTKNSILLVEFANQRRAQGASAKDAMLQAGEVRLRPILMTSFTLILGILPIAIGFGAGAESRRPMGVAILGGMLSSTFLTLLVIPVVYTLFSDLARQARRVFARAPAKPAHPAPHVDPIHP